MADQKAQDQAKTSPPGNGAPVHDYEARYLELFENMPDIYYRTDNNGCLLAISPSCKAQTGYTQDEVIGRPVTDFYADPAQRDALLHALSERGKINDFDITLRHRDGSLRDISVTSHVLIGPDGQACGVEGILRDISERKHAEKQLMELNTRLQTTSNLLQEIVASIPLTVFWKDRQSRFLGCNQRFAADAGFSSPEEMIGKTDEDMVWREQAAMYRADDAEVMSSGVAKLAYEEPKTALDGSTHWLRTSKVPLRDPGGDVIGVLGIFEDITEQKLSGQQLRDSEQRYRALFEQTADYVLVLELQDSGPPIIVDANQSALKKHGYSADELFGQPITFLDTGVPEEVVRDRIRNLHTGRPVYFETEHTCKDGYTFRADVTAQMVVLGDKSLVFTVERDITAREEAERAQVALLRENRHLVRRLMQVQEEERRLLARDLHDELGQLLTGIDARAEFIARHATGDDLQLAARDIQRDAQTLFDASHATLLRLRPASLDALGISAALSELCRQWNRQSGIDCKLHTEGNIDSLDDMYAITIYRLAQEGLTNVQRHANASHASVSIRRSSGRRSDQILVEIADNGQGIHGATGPGGMGLIGMRERVLALGGSFHFSTQPGEGARIEAVLPVESGDTSS